jgi:hypothetical protein
MKRSGFESSHKSSYGVLLEIYFWLGNNRVFNHIGSFIHILKKLGSNLSEYLFIFLKKFNDFFNSLRNQDAEKQQIASGSTDLPVINGKPTPKIIVDTSTPILNATEFDPLKSAIKCSEGRKLCPTFVKKQTIPKIFQLPLLGDDFFLRMARHKLHPDGDGFCQSGLTIREANSMLFESKELNTYEMIIVNIGNEDVIRNQNFL